MARTLWIEDQMGARRLREAGSEPGDVDDVQDTEAHYAVIAAKTGGFDIEERQRLQVAGHPLSPVHVTDKTVIRIVISGKRIGAAVSPLDAGSDPR